VIDSVSTAAYECIQLKMLRVKGGIADYCLNRLIDVEALRQLQSSHRSPAKPVPNRFEIDFVRNVLPAGEK
jgi:hypothetical protein